jgi:peptidoglycan/LPS O-acetylase OafA/YrhL
VLEHASPSRASDPVLSERRSFRLGYRPALDGFRGVSIVAVMLYHTGIMSGGFLGVDMFFVLSGFLITSLLLEELAATGRVSFRSFYVRRALRLLPALAPVVAIAGGAMIAWNPSLGTVGFVLSVIFYTANWAIVYGLPPGLLAHTWSLAIEEQFYVIWPPLLLILVRVIRRRWVLLLVVLSAAGLAVAHRFTIMHTPAGMARIYVGLDAHADPVLIGCALGIFCASRLFRRTRRAVVLWNVLGVLAGLALLALLVRARFPIDYVLASAGTWAAAASALVIVSALLPSSSCGDLLGCAPLTWLGRRSYALYLWHYPVFYVAGPLWKPEAHPTAALLAWVVTVALAAASFRYIEQPVLELKTSLATRDSEPARDLAPLAETVRLSRP